MHPTALQHFRPASTTHYEMCLHEKDHGLAMLLEETE